MKGAQGRVAQTSLRSLRKLDCVRAVRTRCSRRPLGTAFDATPLGGTQAPEGE